MIDYITKPEPNNKTLTKICLKFFTITRGLKSLRRKALLARF